MATMNNEISCFRPTSVAAAAAATTNSQVNMIRRQIRLCMSHPSRSIISNFVISVYKTQSINAVAYVCLCVSFAISLHSLPLTREFQWAMMMMMMMMCN